MNNRKISALFIGLIAIGISARIAAQYQDGSGTMESVMTRLGRVRPAIEGYGTPPHPVHLVARHPRMLCPWTAFCGEKFYESDTTNLRTSAGTTWQSELMGKTTTPSVNTQCNWIGLTNSAITPAFADTTLTGEIATNGLTRAQGTYTDSSGVITIPSAPTVTPTGTTGATTLWYNILAGGQGIYTSIGTSTQTTTANATLSATNYNHISWTPVSGATTYLVLRNTSNSFSGSLTAVAGRDSTSQPDCSTGTCFLDDIANTLAGTVITVPGSNLTNYGHFAIAKTFTATGAQSAQAFGIFSASSSGTMCFEGTFSSVALNINDTFQLTETVQF